MAQHNEFGKEAEKKAAEFLEEKGYKILHRNWRYLKAEIDIIAHDLETNEMVIVEVKARKDNALLDAEEAVNKAKKRLLVKAADQFICTHEINLETRFDILSVYKSKSEWKFNHIPNAFHSSEL